MSFGKVFPRLPDTQGVRVEDFGAKGDGVTDDSTAINRAITDAFSSGHAKVLFGAKDYLIGSKIELLSGIVLQGEGRTKSRIIGDNLSGPLVGASDPAFSVVAGDRVLGGSIHGLTFDNLDQANAGGVGIDLSQVSYFWVSDVTCNRCETGLRIDHISYGCKITNFAIASCDDGVQIRDGAREVCLTHGRINSVGTGIVVAEDTNGGVNGLRFDAITIEAFTSTGIDIDCTSNLGVNSLYATRMRYENAGGVGTAITVDGPIGLAEDIAAHITGTAAYVGGSDAARLNYRNRDLGSRVSSNRSVAPVFLETSNASATLLTSLATLAPGEAYFLEADIMGANADSSIVVHRRIRTVAYRDGSSAIAFGNTSQDSGYRVNGGTTTLASLTNSGFELRLVVVGEAATTISWVGLVQLVRINDAAQFV